MKHYAGIDVSLETSSVCVVDAEGEIVRESKVASEPEALITWFEALGFALERIGHSAVALVLCRGAGRDRQQKRRSPNSTTFRTVGSAQYKACARIELRENTVTWVPRACAMDWIAGRAQTLSPIPAFCNRTPTFAMAWKRAARRSERRRPLRAERSAGGGAARPEVSTCAKLSQGEGVTPGRLQRYRGGAGARGSLRLSSHGRPPGSPPAFSVAPPPPRPSRRRAPRR